MIFGYDVSVVKGLKPLLNPRAVCMATQSFVLALYALADFVLIFFFLSKMLNAHKILHNLIC